ncbi:hypothetical protein [Helicobacter zhangjianzhongii]|uniref:Uncharacterized protein n=1 Tax=Helicobacter zhangjianzhongii TaxID=2974574 RepID=A0ACC6FV11_9HELI|nr:MULTISPECIES: hypothetical protein [unclassified Helicobacter]MDL0081020.1 hypothetical protein [Helicobacter sp. CPD2-1]MDL0083054.1 hypothetical protein [Helicobacter sp. XJK30-2]
MREELLQSFIQAAQECGIQTRIISCHIPIEWTRIHSCSNALESSDDISYLQEYDTLGASKNDLIAQAMHFGAKEKNTSIALVLELLIDMQQRLSRIESHILQEQQRLIPLDSSGIMLGLGHGVLCVRDGEFDKSGFYYVRFSLPTLSQRVIGVFACALTDSLLHIVRIHSHNTQALDSFIAAKEMEQLRQRQVAQFQQKDGK